MKIFIKDPSEIGNLTTEYETYSVKIKNKPYQKNWVKIAKVKGKLNLDVLQNNKMKYWIVVILTLGLATLFDFAKKWRKEYQSGERKKIVFVDRQDHANAVRKINKLIKKQKDVFQLKSEDVNAEKIQPSFKAEIPFAQPDLIKNPPQDIPIENKPELEIELPKEEPIILEEIPLKEEDYLQKLLNKELQLEQIPPQFHTYALCKKAVELDPEMLFNIIVKNYELISIEQFKELTQKAFDQKNEEYLQKLKNQELDFNTIPTQWRTYEVCKGAVELDPETIRFINFPTPLLSQNQYKELVTQAIFTKSQVAVYVRDFEQFHAVKIYLSVLQKARVGGIYLTALHKKFHTQELLELSLPTRQYGQKRIHNLEHFPEHLKTKEICEKAVIANGLNIVDVPKEFLNQDLYKKAICSTIPPEDVKGKNKTQEPQFFTDRDAFRSIPKEALDQDLCDHAFNRDNESDRYLNIQCPNPALRPYHIYEDIPDQFKKKEWVEKVMTHQPNLFKMIPKSQLTIFHWQKAMEKFNTLFNKNIYDKTPLNMLKDFLDSIPKEFLPALKWNIYEFLENKLKINDIESVKNNDDLKKNFEEYWPF